MPRWSARYEYFCGQRGLRNHVEQCDTAIGSPTRQKLQEFTGTYEYKWPEGLLLRAEYRVRLVRTKSSTSPTMRDNESVTDGQSTATLGLIAFFGPKR